MRSTRALLLRFAAPAAALAILGGGASAFTAANSGTTATGAGAGQTTISGYAVGAVKYNPSSSDPRNLATLTFTLTPADGTSDPTTVQATLNGDAGSPTWMASTGTGPACVLGTVASHVTPVTCTPATTTTMASITRLDIVATTN